MRVIVMGTGPFAVPAFHALLDGDDEVVALVTRPIADAGRRKTSANPMSDAALAADVQTVSPDDVNSPEIIDWLRAQQVDLFLVCDFGQILSSECLHASRIGGINLHGSLLPKYRGAAPVHWAILNGDRFTGVSVIHMTPRLDAGPILIAKETPIEPDETTEQLESRLAELGAAAVVEAIALLKRWDGTTPLGKPQDPSQATRAPRLKKQDGLLRWTLSAEQLGNQIRAFTPWPGSFTHVPISLSEPLRLIVHSAQVHENSRSEPPGTIVAADGKQFVVACGKDALALLAVQPAGKRRMEIGEFLRGYPIEIGAILH